MTQYVSDTWFGPGNNYLERNESYSTPNTSARTCQVELRAYFYSNSTYSISSSATKYGHCNINSTSNSYSRAGLSSSGNAWIELTPGSWFYTFNYDSAGNLGWTIGGDFGFNVTLSGTYYGTITTPSTACNEPNIGGSEVIPNVWIWNGSGWVRAKHFYVWNGSSWVQCKSFLAWNGSSWAVTK